MSFSQMARFLPHCTWGTSHRRNARLLLGTVFAILFHPTTSRLNPPIANLLQAPQSVVRFFTYIQQSPMHPHLFTRVCKNPTVVNFAIRDLADQAIHSVKEQLTDLADGTGPIELRLDFEGIESMGSS